MNYEKDYYNILGVPENASNESIKKAFRRLAQKYHPDLHPGDSKMEERFKEISEAYGILSDQKKRAEYDNIRKYGASIPFDEPFVRQKRTYQGGKWEDIFRAGTGGGLNDIFEQLFSGMRAGRSSFSRGADIETEISIPFEVSVIGGKKRVEMRYPDGSVKTIDVVIPAGIEDKKIVVLRGLGQPGERGGSPGDLLVRVNVEKHRFFRRVGNDVLADVHINLKQALLGTRIRVKTPHGEKIELKIPEGTQPGARLRVKGKGIKTPQTTGDFYVVIHVDLPKKISQKAKTKLDEFAKEIGI